MPAIVIPAPINSNHVAPVAAGGTGASTAANARTNLDVYSKSEVTSAIAQSTARFGSMGFISKKTTSQSGTVIFNFSGNRFTGLLFITNNGGACGIYAVKFKAGGTGGLVTKLAGDIGTAPTCDSSGNISVTMDTWSDVTLLTDGYVDFS